MSRGALGKNNWALFLMLLAGIMLGGFIGNAAAGVSGLSWLNYGQSFGFASPIVLDLGILVITFGLSIKITIASIIGVLIAAPFFGKKLVDFDFSSLPAIGVAEIAYILILGTMLPNYLLYYGTEKLTSVHTGLYSYLQPVAATVLGIYRNQVTVGYDNIVAAALIFVGIILVMITYARYKFPVPKVGTPPAAQQPRGQNAGK